MLEERVAVHALLHFQKWNLFPKRRLIIYNLTTIIYKQNVFSFTHLYHYKYDSNTKTQIVLSVRMTNLLGVRITDDVYFINQLLPNLLSRKLILPIIIYDFSIHQQGNQDCELNKTAFNPARKWLKFGKILFFRMMYYLINETTRWER